jgi:nucleoid-associated protein YgaU
MKINMIAKPLFIMMLILGLAAGCASTPDDTSAADQATAEQAIADAKTANAKAEKMGVAWRDTGKIIEEAEAALAAGDYEKATTLANKAQRQAEDAMAQAKSEQDRLNAMGKGDMASEDDSASRDAGMMGGADQYEVSKGDNLWDISGKGEVYANPYQWPLIYKANRSKIQDADLIYPGQVFDIDRAASSSDIDAAIQHAKTRGAWSVGVTEESDKAYMGE